MSENNSPKSPRTNSEVSPIRNLFRKNDTAVVNADSVSKNPENKAEPSDTKKPLDNKENIKNSDPEKQKNAVKSEPEIKNSEKKPEPKQEFKSEPKSETKTEEKTEKETSDEKKDNAKSEQEPEPPKTVSDKEEVKLKENNPEEKAETVENNSDEPEKSKKQSPFSKLKSKIKDIIMSMKQPEEENEPQIEDIFSSTENFVREKNADPLDADAEYKENVIYTAPKEETKHSDDSDISVGDVVKAASKNTKTQKPVNDKNDRDITEILNSDRTEKITAKPKTDKSETNEKSTSQPENTPKNKTEIKSDKTENPQPVKLSEPKNPVAKPQQSNNNDKTAVQKQPAQNVQNDKSVQKPVLQNVSAATKSEPTKQSADSTASNKEETAKNTKQPYNSDKQVISDNKVQNIKKPVDAHSSKTEEKPKTPVEITKPTVSTAVAAYSAENKVIAQPKLKNTDNSTPTPKPEEHITRHSDNTPKPINEKSKNDVLQKQNAVNTQKLPKTDVSDTNKGNIPKTHEQKPINNTSKIDGDDGIKILPWTPKKDVPEQKPTVKAPDTKGKDLSEGSTEILIYHYNKTEPFVVMAGKFTKTLKSEYEDVRKFNSTPLDDSASEKPTNVSSSVVEKSVPKNTHQTKSVTNSNTTIAKTSDIKLIDNSKKQPTEKHNTSSVPQNTKNIQNTAKPVQRENKPSQSTAQNRTVKPTPEISEVKKTVSADRNTPQISDIKKPTEQNTAKKSAAKKPKKPKKNYNFRNIFSGEEEYDPEDVEKIPVKKPQLDDYTNEKDSETIRTEIAENFRHVFTRTAILFVTTILSVIVSIVAQCVPSLFNQSFRNGWLVYAIINFLLFSVSIVVSRVPIVNGIMPLRHFKGNSDTAIATASFAVAIQSIVALFSPHIFVDGTLYIYSSLVILALFLNSLGKMFIILRTYNNFRFLSKPRPKYAGKIYTDIRNAEKISSGLPSKKPIIAYTKKSKFMSNFLQLSYAPDPSEDAAAKIAPYAALMSLICGILYGVMTMNFAGAVSSFALSACITVPICSLLAVNIPLKRLCHNSIKGGAMVTSYETVKQFCDTNVVMIDSSQLYPPGTVTLSGIKAFKESRINDAITAGAAIMFAVDGTMSYIFENIIQDRKDILPKVESVIYEDGMGLVGWINGQRVLIGNRRLLESHNINPPEKSIEDKYLNMGNQVMYISMSGELIAMFILSYNADREIMHELRNLEDNGVSFAIRTVDPNITQQSIAEKFCLFFRCIKILPTSLGNICHEATSSVDDKSRAYLVTRGKIASFARAVSGCIRIKSNITLSIIIQYIAVILGLLIVTLISFISGFEKLGCLEMLLYIGFWAAATIIIPLIKK